MSWYCSCVAILNDDNLLFMLLPVTIVLFAVEDNSYAEIMKILNKTGNEMI